MLVNGTHLSYTPPTRRTIVAQAKQIRILSVKSSEHGKCSSTLTDIRNYSKGAQ